MEANSRFVCACQRRHVLRTGSVSGPRLGACLGLVVLATACGVAPQAVCLPTKLPMHGQLH